MVTNDFWVLSNQSFTLDTTFKSHNCGHLDPFLWFSVKNKGNLGKDFWIVSN